MISDILSAAVSEIDEYREKFPDIAAYHSEKMLDLLNAMIEIRRDLDSPSADIELNPIID